MKNYVKIPSALNTDVHLKVIDGHFVTSHSHTTAFLDFTTMRTRCSEAHGVATLLSMRYSLHTPVDTIVCMDGTEMIGGFFADELTSAGVISMNMHKTTYVLTPEISQSGQMVFKESLLPWIRGKNVLLLLATATTGRTVAQAIETLRYYGAIISGISAIFSVATKICGLPVHSLFTKADLPEYNSWKQEDCPLCAAGVKVDAICNGYGFTPLG